MTKTSENRRIKRKVREWDVIASPFDRFVKKVKKTVSVELFNMVEFLFFYKYKDGWDKGKHLLEMACIFIVVIFAWKGLFGGR